MHTAAEQLHNFSNQMCVYYNGHCITLLAETDSFLGLPFTFDGCNDNSDRNQIGVAHHVNTPMLTVMDLVVPDDWVAVGSNLDPC